MGRAGQKNRVQVSGRNLPRGAGALLAEPHTSTGSAADKLRLTDPSQPGAATVAEAWQALDRLLGPLFAGLPQIPVELGVDETPQAKGGYVRATLAGEVVGMWLNTADPSLLHNATHEAFHYLDYTLFGSRPTGNGKQLERDPAFAPLLEAIKNSLGYQQFRRRLLLHLHDDQLRRELLSDEELLAEAFACWCGERSDDVVFAEEIEQARIERNLLDWNRYDFTPIAEQFDALLARFAGNGMR
jgi:hypothetical protein